MDKEKSHFGEGMSMLCQGNMADWKTWLFPLMRILLLDVHYFILKYILN